MKKIILIISLLFLVSSITVSQLPDSYPFETYLGDDGFLYVTGNVYDSSNNTYDLLVEKYYDTIKVWFSQYSNPNGYDKGMDIVLQDHPTDSKVCVVGYVYNSETNSNDIILLIHEAIGGNIEKVTKYNSPREDKGLGITVDNQRNIYIAGYITNKYLNKDFAVLKYSPQGNLLWKHEYNNPDYGLDDVATDILLDNNFVYAVGYTNGGRMYQNDFIMLTYDQDNSNPAQEFIHRIKYSNEMPTAFILSYVHPDIYYPPMKSRSSVTLITDNGFPHSPGQRDYLTLNITGEYYTGLNWSKKFNGSGNGEDVPTGITADRFGNVYVTGYSYKGHGNNFDFATMRLNKDSGNYGWPQEVEYYDYQNKTGMDKASSIKKWNNLIYVSGACQNAPNGYKVKSYMQTQLGIVENWESTFFPEFSDNNRSFNDMNKAATMEVDTTNGNVWLIAMAWDSTDQYLALRKFDNNGNILGTVENTERNRTQQESDNPELNETNSEAQFELKQNYPNPFNPVTVIHYTVPSNARLTNGQVKGQTSNVKLIIYNSIGQEVATLVNESKPSGNYSVKFDGSNLSSGIYFYRLESREFRDIKRMILLK